MGCNSGGMKYLSALLALVLLPLAPLITGKTLPDAGPNDNAQAWVGAIPCDGKYLITLGAGASGPAAPTPYSLTVSLQ